jgi:hypothetical protein
VTEEQDPEPLYLARPPKPVSEMTDEELDAPTATRSSARSHARRIGPWVAPVGILLAGADRARNHRQMSRTDAAATANLGVDPVTMPRAWF